MAAKATPAALEAPDTVKDQSKIVKKTAEQKLRISQFPITDLIAFVVLRITARRIGFNAPDTIALAKEQFPEEFDFLTGNADLDEEIKLIDLVS